MIPKLSSTNHSFPHPDQANEDGILAWGGDLNPNRLINAYKNGIFPWYMKGEPIIWWSPDPRLIMELNELKVSKSLKKSIKKFTYRFDTNFLKVISNCANKKRKNQNGTWIQDEIINAYLKLHEMGIAHSIESYQNNKLVGGLYGIVVGKVFCGESMFANKADASKSAYSILVNHLKVWGYEFIDCQVPTEHLKSLGAKEISRSEFLEKLHTNNKEPVQHEWEIIPSLINN